MPARSYVYAERTKELFTGKELDGETGWYYHGARFRNPALGPWLSVDPLASNDLSISPYHYAHNSPVNRFDPDGKDDLGTNFLTPEEREKMWDNYARVNREGGRRKELTVATALLPTILDPMSTTLTVAGSYPSPYSAVLFGAAASLKIISTGSKLAHYKFSSNIDELDVAGDVIGLGISQSIHPLAGELIDQTLDLASEHKTNKKVDDKYKIHRPSPTKFSLSKTVALERGMITSPSPRELWEEMQAKKKEEEKRKEEENNTN